jgi:hypothetical protein
MNLLRGRRKRLSASGSMPSVHAPPRKDCTVISGP